MSADGAFEPLRFDAELGPELEAAMAEQRAEVEAIADGPWPPAFDDTIAALERSGQRLHVAERVFGDASPEHHRGARNRQPGGSSGAAAPACVRR